MYLPKLFFILFLTNSCETNNSDISDLPVNSSIRFTKAETINEIALPEGFQRMEMQQASFGEWLRTIRLKKDDHVYLYDGSLKKNQSMHIAVLDIPTGNKDLQQCADAVMRMRAEYLFERKRFTEIVFKDNKGKSYAWTGKDNKKGFNQYLETVFSYCNTASLQKQLTPVEDWQQIQPGDVFIKGGFPGHAMIVVDVGINEQGEKIFMLAQSYMPAQDIHIVKNPMNEARGPWYEIDGSNEIVTPGWTFYKSQLYNWEHKKVLLAMEDF